jgi:hypothetical protein
MPGYVSAGGFRYDGEDPASLKAEVAAAQAAVAALDANRAFVTNEILTTTQLLAQFPAAAGYRGKYCRVSDMWGAVDGVYRCGWNGRIYYWEPTTQIQLVGQMSSPVTNGSTVNIDPLLSPPIIEMIGAGPGTLQSANLNFMNSNIPPGLVKEVRGSFSSLLGTLNILGTGIGSTLSLLLNGVQRIGSYDNGSAVVWRKLN